jgi:hypothetical protein
LSLFAKDPYNIEEVEYKFTIDVVNKAPIVSNTDLGSITVILGSNLDFYLDKDLFIDLDNEKLYYTAVA